MMNKKSLFRKDTMQLVITEREPSQPLSEKQQKSVQTLTPLICKFLTRYSNDDKRRRVLIELITTERTYVSSLNDLIELYYNPLSQSINQRAGIIDSESLNKLLGDFDQIRDIHKNIILKTMDECYDEFKNPFPCHDTFLKIPNVFIEVYPRLRQLYLTYLANNHQSDAILAKLRKNRKFRDFLKEKLFDPQSQNREIEDFLILPTQRMAAYGLLFERAIKYLPTETHQKEHDRYETAHKQLSEIGREMNSEQNVQESQKALLSVAEYIGKVPPYFDIMKPGRKFYGKFDCQRQQKTLKKYQIFIMSDVLIITIREEWSVFSSTKVSFVEAAPLAQIHFSPGDNPAFEDCSFAIDTNGYEAKFVFMAPNSIERDNIVFKIRKLKKHIFDRVAKMSEEGMTFISKNMQEIHDSYFNPRKIMTRDEAIQSLA